MKLFECQACGQPLYFENSRCENCGRRLGCVPSIQEISALEPREEGGWRALALSGKSFRFCANSQYEACNWLVPAEEASPYCRACRHNRTVPDLSSPRNLDRWRRLEAAKRRLFYTLLKLDLPLATRAEDPQGLAFDFLADPAENSSDGPSILTGHDNGLITINIAEADDAERERRRHSMGEPYRTLLGHLRHEVGHYFWNVLVRDDPSLEGFRRIFGDERQDYGEALKAHYARGSRENWQDEFVSSYAASHPWEDFAETWAHYLHIVDTLETAHAFGLAVRPRIARGQEIAADIDFDPHREADLNRLITAWLPLTFAVNSLNRSMGQPDLYPFVLAPAVIAKLGFIHERIHSWSGRRPGGEAGRHIPKAVIGGPNSRAGAPQSA
ncbi:zinc-binding metallopeptidase family protein [Microvirga mediterraneensis]|uniref:Putative zinc-binding peptidase n=1 Tax=Microvirga mediterraneensis TaxID=2754695 RepID=A0A838BQ89_9HYPH|nr:putative zinc-binding peptidase [Microvirga mediterraneensis]MBA1157540.1 putative zinc-binding peptidase [Microvirga mediterraneensis]